MAKKALIGKVQQQKYVSKEEQKTVFPVTVDEAVKVKKEDGNYTNLKVALDSKWGDALVVKVYATNEDDTTDVVYYMFAFKEGKDTEATNSSHRFDLSEALSCSNQDFKKLCRDKTGEEVNITMRYTPLTVESVEDRIAKSAYLKSLFLRIVRLHGGSDNTIIITDEDGNTYVSGDTIYLAKYPGKLFVGTEHLNADYISMLQNLAANNSRLYSHYLQLTSDPKDEDVDSSVKLNFSTNLAGTLTGNDYTEPKNIPTGYDTTQLNIANINQFIGYMLSDGIPILVMPDDYPYEGSNAVKLEYMSASKSGRLHISDLLNEWKDGNIVKTSVLSSGFPPSHFNIVFNPERVFYLDTPEDVNIDKNTDWAGDVILKGNYAEENNYLTLRSEVEENQIDKYFLCKKSTEPEEAYRRFSTISITKDEIEAGVTLNIRPGDYIGSSTYVPFSVATPCFLEDTIHVEYGGEDTGKTIYIKCNITQDAIGEPVSGIIAEETVTEDNSFTYYCLLKVKENTSNVTIYRFSVESVGNNSQNLDYTLSYIPLSTATGDEIVNGHTTIGDVLDNVGTEEFDNNIIRVGSTIDTTVNKYTLYRVNIRPTALNTRLVPTNGVVEFRDNTNDIRYTITFNSSDSTPTPVPDTPIPGSYEDNSSNIVVLDMDDKPIMDRLKSKITYDNVVYSQELETIRVLEDSVFSKLDSLVDGSFMQYMTRLEEIPPYAFTDCVNMTTIVLPPNLKKIGRYAFAGCRSLTTIVIPDSVTSIELDAFTGCLGLTEIDFGEGILDINDLGLEMSDNINTIILRGITEVPDSDPVAMRGVILHEKMGLHLPNRIAFSTAIQGAGSAGLNFYVPTELVSLYPGTNWGTYFPNATWNTMASLIH